MTTDGGTVSAGLSVDSAMVPPAVPESVTVHVLERPALKSEVEQPR
jgi:hypothetical protein